MGSTKIAFGSCIRYKRYGKGEQDIWKAISKEDPDHLLILGDQIYMDFGIWPFSKEYIGKPKKYSQEQFEVSMRSKYALQYAEPDFKALLTKMRSKSEGYHATWDDHDFAWNDAKGVEVKEPIKTTALKLFNEFNYESVTVDKLYRSFTIKDQAKVIILDNRYYAQLPDKETSMLGEQQFAWLEAEVKNNTLPFTIICGSLTLTRGGECWAKYPKEYAKFCDLVRGKAGVVYLSGDIHTNEFDPIGHRRRWPNIFKKIEHPCYEATSSGIAINMIGLPFNLDKQQNWGKLELDDNQMKVTLFKRVKKAKSYTIALD